MYQKDIDRNLYNLRQAKKDLRLVRDDEEVMIEHEELCNYTKVAYKNINNGTEYLKALEPEVDPEPVYKQTKYPFFEYMYSIGYTPWDAHANSLPFTDNFTWENWCEGVELCRAHNVNLTRFFLVTRDGTGLDYVVPFKKIHKKYDLFDTDCEGYDELYKRLNEFWERGITTMLCMASGIKDVANRFKYSVWNGKNNVNGTVTESKNFMSHDPTEDVMVNMILHFHFDRGWKDKPVIYEIINEYNANDVRMKNFYTKVVVRLVNAGVPIERIAVEYWNSSKCWELSKERKGIIMPHHGCNHAETCGRLHRGELQKYFHEAQIVFMLDSDGQCNNPEEGFYPGVGLVGLLWNANFRRYAPTHIKPSFIMDEALAGNGLIVWSAGAYYKNADGNAPNYKDWKKVAMTGLTEAEVNEWFKYFKKKRKEYNKPVPSDFTVNPKLFVNKNGNPVGELMAIKQATNRMFEED